MRTRVLSGAFAILVILTALNTLNGQTGYPRSRRQGSANQTRNTGVYGGPAVTFHGKLKNLTKKEIVIETEDDQAIEIRRYHKTKFMKDDREIKPADIPIGSSLTVDVTQDPDLKPVAVNVFVDPVKAQAK